MRWIILTLAVLAALYIGSALGAASLLTYVVFHIGSFGVTGAMIAGIVLLFGFSRLLRK